MFDCNIVLSFNPTKEMNTTEFKRRSSDYMFDELESVLKMGGRYSSFIFKNDYRSSDNYINNMSNCIILDFDDGITIDEFKKSANFAYAIGTTKSHNIEKNGVICERFRVIIPTETAISLNSEDYSNMMSELFLEYTEADKACKDTARAYSGFTGAEVQIKRGDYFCWENYFKSYLDKKEIMRRWQQKERERAVKNFENEDTKIDWYRENWLNDKMRSILKIDEKFTSGNRNNSLYSYARFFKDLELVDSEIVEAIEWINNMELHEIEVKQILKGLRISI